MIHMTHPPIVIFILDLICGVPLSYYLATISSKPRLTFIVINILFLTMVALWLQKEMWKTIALWLVEDEDLSQEIAVLYAANWREEKKDMSSLEDEEIERQIQRELQAAAERPLRNRVVT